ncbi:hypothetical protein EVAR_63395_1 [Eumeta japonica]|uniref:Uncharacterized protein n=1 Tax=Eumeta variegata TaxID=151549 RepID=A0A4C1YX91_EUMVA|nr:hypothetical protein EVAR_63395_1 [Eumeta japonica]
MSKGVTGSPLRAVQGRSRKPRRTIATTNINMFKRRKLRANVQRNRKCVLSIDTENGIRSRKKIGVMVDSVISQYRRCRNTFYAHASGAADGKR